MNRKPPNRNVNRNRQPNIPKVKTKARTRGIKTIVNGIQFDSTTEAAFYEYLLKDKTIKHIILQPKYQIIDPYRVDCKKCKATGKILNQRTRNFNRCVRCKATGRVEKAASFYTADFKVTYIDGYTEVIDIKGYKSERDFPLRKNLFEIKTGVELIVIRLKDREWVRD